MKLVRQVAVVLHLDRTHAPKLAMTDQNLSFAKEGVRGKQRGVEISGLNPADEDPIRTKDDVKSRSKVAWEHVHALLRLRRVPESEKGMYWRGEGWRDVGARGRGGQADRSWNENRAGRCLSAKVCDF